MAAPVKTSKWGSLLSQAVAGVESRLDNILAEANEVPARNAQAVAPSKLNHNSTRSRSSYSANDRLQARLTKAVGKNARNSSSDISAGSSPRPSTERPDRALPDEPISASNDASAELPNPARTTAKGAPTVAITNGQPLEEERRDLDTGQSTEQPTDPHAFANEAESEDNALLKLALPADDEQAEQPQNRQTKYTVSQSELAELAKEMESIKKRQQEEIQEHVEQIDSLQSKLEYLSKSAAESAKLAAASAPSGSMVRRLADKDEKIALLLEERQKLSASEQRFRALIKRLRLQNSEIEKEMEQIKASRDKALADVEVMHERFTDTTNNRDSQEETERSVTALRSEVSSLRTQLSTKDEAYRALERETQAKIAQAESDGAKALNQALAAEWKEQKELEDANRILKSEKKSRAEVFRQERIQWQETLERSANRSRATEEELRSELRSLESKLEASRACAEEASSASGSEAQLKFLRQIETLQSQYASSRANWQGIESSLLAKVAQIERERDEAQRRESEMRKKARDAASRNRNLEDEALNAQATLNKAQQELESCRDQLSELEATSRRTEQALEQANAALEKEKANSVKPVEAGDMDRRPWIEDLPAVNSKCRQSRPNSPMLAVSRTLSSDFAGIPAVGKLRRTPTLGSGTDNLLESSISMRRLPSQPALTRSTTTSTAEPEYPSTPFSPFEPAGNVLQLHSPPTDERQSVVDDAMPSSPRNLTQDMISVSTAAAGPSVQLVERMSAAIRRLEAEKVVAKKEMAWVCTQRDEARTAMVGLMKDVEEARATAKRVPQLEEDVSTLDARYQTTLEMLGEKSELVEELKADVTDLKFMYRELIERTVK